MFKRRASRLPRPPGKKERRQWIEGLPPKQREQFEQRIRQMAGEAAERELLDVLANGDWGHWAAKMYELNDSEFSTIQEQLRQVWNPDTPTEIKNRVLTDWLQAGKNTVVADWDRGRMWVNPANLLAELASILLLNKDRLAICRNPECGSPYFLAAKKGRK